MVSNECEQYAERSRSLCQATICEFNTSGKPVENREAATYTQVAALLYVGQKMNDIAVLLGQLLAVEQKRLEIELKNKDTAPNKEKK